MDGRGIWAAGLSSVERPHRSGDNELLPRSPTRYFIAAAAGGLRVSGRPVNYHPFALTRVAVCTDQSGGAIQGTQRIEWKARSHRGLALKGTGI